MDVDLVRAPNRAQNRAPNGVVSRLWRAVPLAAILGLWATPGHALTASGAEPYWANSVQMFDQHTPGHPTREASAIAGVAYWCGLPVNARFFSTCRYGGMDSNNVASVVTNRGTYNLISVYRYWACPPNTQLIASWSENGITHRPACLDWGTPPAPGASVPD